MKTVDSGVLRKGAGARGGHGRALQPLRIALVLPTDRAYARGIVQAIVLAAKNRRILTGRNGGGAWLFRIFGDAALVSVDALRQTLDQWEPDAIVAEIFTLPGAAQLLRSLGKPVVELFPEQNTSDFPAITVDNPAIGRMAAQHFLDRGMRYFAYFGDGVSQWSQLRGRGFLEAVQQAHAAAVQAEQDAHPGDPPRETIAEPLVQTFNYWDPRDSALAWNARRDAQLARWIGSLPKPVGIFAGNDMLASNLLQLAKASGASIPEDVAVLGVDNDELLCEMWQLPLSSIRLPVEQAGAEAVDMLDNLLSGKPAKSILGLAPVGVVARQSSDVLAVQDEDLAAALRYIHKHALGPLSVKKLVESLPVNRRTLERRFQEVLGRSPLDEIHRIRVERAKALLQSGYQVAEVAMRCGFITTQAMARAFHQTLGVSPRAYRASLGLKETF